MLLFGLSDGSRKTQRILPSCWVYRVSNVLRIEKRAIFKLNKNLAFEEHVYIEVTTLLKRSGGVGQLMV
jgi:hypothetical protein